MCSSDLANGDGRWDLFVRRVAGGTAGNGVLEKVLLLQQSNGRFASQVPTSAQTATGRSWPAAAATLDVRDVNADGFVDVVLDPVMNPWDIAALVPVVRGAGGIITDWTGQPPYPAESIIAAATPDLHAATLKVLRN